MKSYKHTLLLVACLMASLIVFFQLFLPSKATIEKVTYSWSALEKQKAISEDSLATKQEKLDSMIVVCAVKTQSTEEYLADTSLYWVIQEIDKYNRLAQRAKDMQSR